MGGRQSREGSRSYGRSHSSASSQDAAGWRSHPLPPPPPPHPPAPSAVQGYDELVDAYPAAYPYVPPQGYAAQPSGYAPPAQSHPPRPRPRLDRRYSKIADNYTSLEQVLMGGRQSREGSRSYGRSHSSASSQDAAGWRSHPLPPPPPPHPPALRAAQGYDELVDAYPAAYPYVPPQGYAAQPSGYAPPAQSHPPRPRPRLDRRYSKIADNYTSLEQVTEALAQAGLESSNLILGIDFTKSNEWTGKRSFNGRSLHHIGDVQNPYEQAISIIGRTLSAFDEDNLIPCFGFGDASTHDQDVFSFYPDERPCNGFTEALTRYREIVPHLRLAGPTSFAPVIEMAMTIVEQSGGQYHVLVIIADGQVTRSVDTEFGQLSSQEQKTVDAIVKASEFPLSIILVGVGDGPWDMMKEFDDNIPARAFDNFQFVNFTAIMSKNIPQARKETEFALGALMEIPSQYKATLEILGHRCGRSPERVPLPPPPGNYGAASMGSKAFGSTSFQHNSPYSGFGSKGTPSPAAYPEYEATSKATPAAYSGYETTSTAPPAVASSWDNQVCPICLTNPKDMAFGCGHQTCCECGTNLSSCPICRSEITTKIKLY